MILLHEWLLYQVQLLLLTGLCTFILIFFRTNAKFSQKPDLS